VIGNVPFGKYKVADLSNRAYARFSIHNYFFGRALDLVRPGGLVCFITSSHTMDALDDAAREYIGAQAHLLGAIRLPQGTFAGIAATDVQTDILFLRKRQRGKRSSSEWLKLSIVPMPCASAVPRALPADQRLVRPAPGVLHRQHPARAMATRKWRRPCSRATSKRPCTERIGLLPTDVYRTAVVDKSAERTTVPPTRPAPSPAATAFTMGGCIASRVPRWSMCMTSSTARSARGSSACVPSATRPGHCSMRS
jgi:hypothetical protein